MNWRWAVLFAAGVSALGGCAILQDILEGVETREPVPWVQAGSPQPASDAESLLLYFHHLRKLSGPDLGREHEAARQAYARSRTDFNRVRLAIVLSLPSSAFNDDARALELLEQVAKNPSDRLQGLALLLNTHLQEQKRMNANLQGLQQKLDALKSLERNLIERGK
jgi:hypothetical protein